MPFCENCGAVLQNESKFCGSCGTSATPGQRGAGGQGSGSVSSETVQTSIGVPVSSAAGAATANIKPNIAAMLCYLGLPLSLLGLIAPVAFLVMKPYKQDPFIRFHAFQAVGVSIVGNVLWIIVDQATRVQTFWGQSQMSQFSLAMLIVLILADVLLVGKAYAKSMFKIPGLGDVAAQLADRNLQR